MPRIVTTAASLPSTASGSTEIFSVAERSHGALAAHGRFSPTAIPATCETLIHGLLAVIRQATIPRPAF
jgi:hypothetical protein